MAGLSASVRDHYSQGGLLDRILGFVANAGGDPENPSPESLYACDQMHARGIVATRAHAERAGIGSGMHVLDLGCGIGGSARYLASARACRVTGIDLTPEPIEVATELTRRCGLSERIEFRHADAVAMPFDDAAFDHVWSHNVIMNIENKDGLFAEIVRVLKPGGRYSCAEFVRGEAGEPIYPLPWASDPSSSFLPTSDQMRACFENAGLRVIGQTDLSEANRVFFKEMNAPVERGEPPLGVNPQAFKSREEFIERVRNAGKSAREGRLAEQFIVAEKT